MKLAGHPDAGVRSAILGFGHIARTQRRLTRTKIQPLVEAALHDPSDYVRGQAAAAADDIETFLGWALRRAG